MQKPNQAMPVCEIMGVRIAVTDMETTVRRIEEHLDDWRGEYICVANVHTTVTAHDDPSYRAVQNGAVMALPDGGPLSQYSRRKGFAQAARVTGPDLMKEMLRESAQKHYRHSSGENHPELSRRRHCRDGVSPFPPPDRGGRRSCRSRHQ